MANKKSPRDTKNGARGQVADNIAKDLKKALFAAQKLECKFRPMDESRTSESTSKYHKEFVAVPSGALCGALKASVHLAESHDVEFDTYCCVKVQMGEIELAVDIKLFIVAKITPAVERAIKDRIMTQFRRALPSQRDLFNG